MSATSVRWAALGVFFLLGIPGMIVSSINDNNGAAATFGLIAVVAAVVLIAVTAVTTGRLSPDVGTGSGSPSDDRAAALEARIGRLVANGADEAEVRALVGDAVKYGRTAPKNGQMRSRS